MLKRKFLVLVSALFLSLTLTSFAQTDKEQIDLTDKWALQFQIDRNFTLNSFQGGTISGKYHFSNRSALRFGVTLGYVGNDIEESETRVYTDTTMFNKYDGERTGNDINFIVQYLSYWEMNNSISAFWGAGLNYRTASDKYEVIDKNILDTKKSGFGINLLMGVEWFVRSNIGINAEYGTGFGFSNEERTMKHYRNKKLIESRYSKESGLRLSDHHVKFGLSVYF